MNQPARAGETGEASLALEGMRVVELAGGSAAAYCTHLLAGYGADVVRVEGADQLTSVDWQLSPDEQTYLLAGKRRVSLAGAEPATARAPLDALVATADVVVVDGRPGRFDVAAWRASNPALVAVSISPFGQSGPDRFLPADDLIAFAAGGMLSLTGDPARTPLVTGGSQALYFGGLHAFSATLSTYFGALMQGEGDWVDISLQECMAGSLELYGPAASRGEPAALRTGNYHRAIWALYPCADGYAGVFCLERQVPALFALLGEDCLAEQRFRDHTQRVEHDEELAAYVLSFLVDQTGDDLARLGAQHRIPFGKVRTPAELLTSPALLQREFFDTVQPADGPPQTVPGRPFLGLAWSGGGPLTEPASVDAIDAITDQWRHR